MYLVPFTDSIFSFFKKVSLRYYQKEHEKLQEVRRFLEDEDDKICSDQEYQEPLIQEE